MGIKRFPTVVCFCIMLLSAKKLHRQERQVYPIVRDTFNRFADSLELEGEIVAISGYDPLCGVACNSETMVVRLSAKYAAYPYPDIYVAFTCFHKVSRNDLKKVPRIKVEKIASDDHSCFWEESPSNPIDSKG